MFRATNRSRDIVADVLVLLPLRRVGSREVIGDNIGTRIAGLESLIQNESADRLAARSRAPVTQRVTVDRLSLGIQREPSCAGRFEHGLQKTLRGSCAVIILAENCFAAGNRGDAVRSGHRLIRRSEIDSYTDSLFVSDDRPISRSEGGATTPGLVDVFKPVVLARSPRPGPATPFRARRPLVVIPNARRAQGHH